MYARSMNVPVNIEDLNGVERFQITWNISIMQYCNAVTYNARLPEVDAVQVLVRMCTHTCTHTCTETYPVVLAV